MHLNCLIVADWKSIVNVCIFLNKLNLEKFVNWEIGPSIADKLHKEKISDDYLLASPPLSLPLPPSLLSDPDDRTQR